MRTAPKTPYEIRLDLLELARIILQSQHDVKTSANGNNRVSSPTTEDVIAEAEKMNVFISKANQTH